MDPMLSIDGPLTGSEPDEDALAVSAPDDGEDEDLSRGPGEGDARIMAWARAM